MAVNQNRHPIAALDAEKTVEQWNQKHPVGTPIKINGVVTESSAPAMVLAGKTPVVWAKGIFNPVHLSKTTVINHQTENKIMTIKEIIADIIKKEGGYVNHPADKGGPTNHGITAKSYAEYFQREWENITAPEIKAVSKELAEKIYYKLYYIRPNIIALPERIQPIMLDMAVNHGRRGAVKILQQALVYAGYSHSIPDGIIGVKTLGAATKATQDLGKIFISYLVESRIKAYQEIIKKDPSQAIFEDGWMARAHSFMPDEAHA